MTRRGVMLQQTEEEERAVGSKTLSLMFSTQTEIFGKMRKARVVSDSGSF